MPIYDCQTCGFIYNTSIGDNKNGIPKQTDLPALRFSLCQDCGMAKCHKKVRPAKAYKGLEVQFYDMFCGKASAKTYSSEDVAGKKVLDVGAGTGRIGLVLQQAGADVTLLENSTEMLEVLEKRTQNQQNVTVLAADVLEDMLPENTYDMAILSDGLLQHMQTEGQQLSALRNVLMSLKDDGTAIVELFLPEQLSFTSQRAKEVRKGLHYYLDIKAEVSLPLKEIRTQLRFEEVKEGEVVKTMRLERLLQLIFPQDIERLLRDIYLATNQSFKLLSKERFDFGTSEHAYKIERSQHRGQNRYDWIQAGYPFATSESHNVSWWRFVIKKVKN